MEGCPFWDSCEIGQLIHLLVVNALVEKLSPTAEQLGCLNHLERARAMATAPSWADKQLAILDKAGDPREVVRQLISQSRMSAS